MSLRKWLQAEEEKLQKIFESSEKEIKEVVLPAAIAVTDFIKTIVLIDGSDLLGAIAGSAGTAVEDKLRSVLPTIIAELQLAQQFLSTNPSTNAIIAQVVKSAQSLTGNARTSFLIEFSGQIATALADGKLTIAEGVLLTQEYFNERPN